MAKLQTAADFGIVEPQGVVQASAVSNAGVVGSAIESFGRAGMSAADQLGDQARRERLRQEEEARRQAEKDKAAQEQLAWADGVTKVYEAQAQVDQQFQGDTDWKTWSQRYPAALTKALAGAGSGIQDPMQRELFQAQVVRRAIAEGTAQMQGQARKQEVDGGRAWLADTLQKNTDAALRAQSEPARVALLKANQAAIDGAEGKGYISATEAVKFRQDSAENYTRSYVALLGAQSPRAALAYLTQGTNYKGPGVAAHDEAAMASAATPHVTVAYLDMIANGESGGDPNAPDGGMFQFKDETAKQYGYRPGMSVEEQAQRAAQLAENNYAYLSKQLGRAPTDTELALAHQQGAAGATALLQNPDRPAYDVLTRAYGGGKSGQAQAASAILKNGGDLDMTAGQFSQKVQDYYEGKRAPQGTPLQVSKPIGGWPSGPAMDALNLSPQERYLYQHHLSNLEQGKAVLNPDGSRSTLLQATVERDGRFYNIPTVWDGKELSAQDAIKRAGAEGWDKWPSYATEEQAQARYDEMHKAIEGDVGPATTPVDALNFPKVGNPVDYLDPAWRADEIQRQEGAIRAQDAQARAELERQQAQARADLAGRLDDEYASLLTTGKPADPKAPVTSQDMAAAGYTPKQIDDSMGKLRRAQDSYTARQSILFASPQQEQDLLKAAIPQGAGFAEQAQIQALLVKAVQDKQAAIAKDPAGYVAANAPEVAQAITSSLSDPSQMPGAVKKMDAYFDKLDVPQSQRVYLPESTAKQLVSGILAQPAADVGNTIAGMAQKYGDNWDKILGAMVTKGGLPTAYEMVAAVDDPYSRAQLAEGLADPQGTKAALGKSSDGTQISTQIDTLIDQDESMTALGTSLSYGGGTKFAEIKDATRIMAYRLARQMTPEQAAAKAIATVTTDKYDFLDAARVPKGMGDRVDNAIAVTMENLSADMLRPRPDPATGDLYATPQEQRALALKNAQAGHWVTNEQDNGIFLMGGDGYPVMLAGDARRGPRRLELLFNSLPDQVSAWYLPTPNPETIPNPGL